MILRRRTRSYPVSNRRKNSRHCSGSQVGEIGLADLVEIAASDGTGLEHGAELVSVENVLGHGVCPCGCRMAVLVVTEPDRRQAIGLGRPVAEPDRAPAADGTDDRGAGGESGEYGHEASSLRSMAVSAKCVTYGIGMVDAGAEAEPGTPVGALLDNLGDRALDHVGNIGDRSSSPGMWSRKQVAEAPTMRSSGVRGRSVSIRVRYIASPSRATSCTSSSNRSRRPSRWSRETKSEWCRE